MLFKAPMVRALLDGSKKQTRRVMKPQPARIGNTTILEYRGGLYQPEKLPANSNLFNHCPYGRPGDQVWVRETHAQVFDVDVPDGRPVGPIGTTGSPARPGWKSRFVYLADGEMPNVQWHHVGDSQPVRWTPSIHMPRAASRILLEIVSVRVERLQDISEADALAEGVRLDKAGGFFIDGADGRHASPVASSAVEAFKSLWESTGGDWDANKWCWAITFKQVMP